MVAGTLQIEMMANVARLADDMRKARSTVETAMGGINSAIASVSRALGGLGGGLSIAAFAAMVKGAIDAADHMNDLSKATGVAVEQLAGLELAAKQSGAELDSLAASLNKLSVNMGANQAKFKALGVTAKDPLEAFKQLSDIFVAIRDPQLRAAVAAEALGKSWAGAAPLLSEGGRRIAEMVEKGRQLSGITSELTDGADDFNDKLEELKAAAKGTGERIAMSLLPPLTGVLNAFNNLIQRPTEKVDVPWFDEMFTNSTVRINTWLVAMEKGTAKLASMAGMDKLAQAHLDNAARLQSGVDAATGRQRDSALASFRAGERASYGSVPVSTAAAAKADADGRAFVGHADTAKAIQDQDSAYRSLKKSLEEMLVPQHELTEVTKLQISLGALTEKQRDYILQSGPSELVMLAQRVDAKKRDEEATKAQVDAYQQEAAAREQFNSEWSAELQRRDDVVAATEKNLEQIKFETTLIGMSNEQREISVALHDLEASGINKESLAWQSLAPRIKEAIEARGAAQKMDDLRRQSLDQWNSLWSTVERTGKDVFVQLFSHGKSAFQGIGQAIKASVIDLLYQLTARPFIIKIGTSIASSMGLMSAADLARADTGGGFMGMLGNAGSLGSLFSGNGSSFSGLSSLFGAAGTGALAGGLAAGLSTGGLGFGATAGTLGGLGGLSAGGLGAGVATGGITGLSTAAGAGLGLSTTAAGAGALGTAGAGAAGAAGLAAIPVAGWVALAAIAAYSLFGGGDNDNAQPAGPPSQYNVGLYGVTSSGIGRNSGYGFLGPRKDGGQYSDGSGFSADQYTALDAQVRNVFAAFNAAGTAAGITADKFDALNVSVYQTGASLGEGLAADMSALGDEIAKQLIPTIGRWQQAGESLSDTFQRVTGDTVAMGNVFKMFGGDASRLGDLGGNSRFVNQENLLARFGGLGNFQSANQSFYNSFYTDQERLDDEKKLVATTFAKLGIQAPGSRTQYRDLVNNANLTTDAGQNLYTTLLNLAPAFNDVATAADAATDAAKSLATANDYYFASLVDQRRFEAEQRLGQNPSTRGLLRRVNGFASGGWHGGGWAVVGEEGPELVNMPPARVYSNQQSQGLVDMSETVGELRAMHLTVGRKLHSIDRMLHRWEGNGIPLRGDPDNPLPVHDSANDA